MISVCIPTRGKTASLFEFVRETTRNAVMPDTRFVIGYDEDEAVPAGVSDIDSRISVSVAPREDSLGAKYNRLARECPADIYVMGLDDVAIATPGWDAELVEAASVFKDGIGCVYIGKEIHGETLPSMQAVTRRLVDLIGFFVVPHYPYWWGNTTLDEIATMAGRVVLSSIETRYPTVFGKPERRDIGYWAKFFDDTRPWREAIADQVIDATDDGPTRKAILRKLRPLARQHFEYRNSKVRDPAYADVVIRELSRAAPMDARHERLRAKAEQFLSEMS